MENKTKIYLSILVLGLFISILLLSLYYGQEITEDYSFKLTIKFNEINYTLNNRYIQYQNFQIGDLTLGTEGTFTRTYKFPTLTGCIKKEVNGQERFILQPIYFQFTENNPNEQTIYNYRSPKQQEIKLVPGQQKTYKIFGSTSGQADEFLNYTLTSLVLYKVDQKEDNPFTFSYSTDVIMGNICPGTFGKEYLEIPIN